MNAGRAIEALLIMATEPLAAADLAASWDCRSVM